MIKNFAGTLKLVSMLMLPLFVITGCAASHVQRDEQPDSEVRQKDVDRTVSEFLEALKSGDYGKAYGYVFVPGMDETQYVSSLQEARDRDRSSIQGFKILETRVLTKSALVEAEIEMSYTPDGSDEVLQITRINRYELTETKGWRITGEECISSCGN